MIVQVVIKGMESAKLRGELLITADLNLKKLKEICSRFECVCGKDRCIERERDRGGQGERRERATVEVLRVTLGKRDTLLEVVRRENAKR